MTAKKYTPAVALDSGMMTTRLTMLSQTSSSGATGIYVKYKALNNLQYRDFLSCALCIFLGVGEKYIVPCGRSLHTSLADVLIVYTKKQAELSPVVHIEKLMKTSVFIAYSFPTALHVKSHLIFLKVLLILTPITYRAKLCFWPPASKYNNNNIE